MNIRQLYIVCIIIQLALIGCQNTTKDIREGIKLASAYDKTLYLEDIQHKLSSRTTSDSIALQAKYVDEWIMDQVIYNQAQESLGDDPEILGLVEKYEASLYNHKLKELHLKENLDTTITQAQLDTFYVQHKDEFNLQESIVRFLYIKVPKASYNDTIETLWKTEDLPGLRSYVSQQGGIQQLDINAWHYYSELKAICPEKLSAKINLKKTESYSLKNEKNYFFIKVLEHKSKKEKAPLSFVKEPIVRRVLFERSNTLLKEWKQHLFKENIKSKSIYIRH